MFCAQREREERDAASRAADVSSRIAHQTLADFYGREVLRLGQDTTDEPGPAG